MKSMVRQAMKRIAVGLIAIAMICPYVLTSSYAWAEAPVEKVTDASLTFQEPCGISSDVLVSRGTARYGTYTGEDGSSISWTLTAAGALTVSGSGCLPRIWYDNAGNFFGAEIKTVTIKEGITSLDNGTFFQCSNLTKVTLPISLTTIGFAAFGECTNLSAFNIPSTVSYIGEYAFYSCVSLQSITLPSTVTYIDTEAFANCTALTSASIYGDIGTNSFNNCVSLSSLKINGTPAFIGDGAFAYCTSLSSVDVPSSVGEIGVGAFAYCETMTSASVYGELLESAFDCCYALEKLTLNSPCRTIGRRAFADCIAMTSIVLPDTVRIINEGAFQGCKSLRSITLPEGLKTIHNHTFFDCASLTSVTIPAGVTAIEKCTFTNCTALTTVNLPAGITAIGEGAFCDCSALTTISIPDRCTSIGEQAFYGCKNLQSIAIPASTTNIGNAAFYQCEKLESITIPQNVKVIPNHAFTFCESLKSITLPNGLTEIGSYAFSDCNMLDSIALPSSMTMIDEYAFYECSSLKNVSIPSGITVLPEGVFAKCGSLTAVVLPSNLSEIEKAAFFNCEALGSIRIPSGLTYLGQAAFSGCKSLQSITLPTGVTQLPDFVFMDCESLENVAILGNATSIGDYSFAECTSLVNMSLPDTVANIGNQAFSFCGKLSTIKMPQQLKTLGAAAFLGCEELTSVELGGLVRSIGDDVFAACTSLENLILDSNNHNFNIIDSALYTADKTRLISFVPTNNLVSVTIPNTVTSIGNLTFYQCETITDITLPDSITEIGNLMFYHCTQLQSITIPDSVTKIGAYAFAGCEKLQDIEIPDAVQSIGEGAFYHCKGLETIDLPDGLKTVEHGTFYGCRALKALTLPSAMTKVDDYAFALCSSLSTIQFPQNLTGIGQYAFAGCDALSRCSIPSSVTSLGEGAFAECSSLTSISLPSGIANISDFLFYDCPSLEAVDLHGDIFAIGVGSFSSSEALSKVVFAGNAPEVIGSRAFEKTNKELVFHYDQAAEGWTTPEWTGPDQAVYRTSTTYSGTCGEQLEWNLVTATGELTIWGTGEMYSWDAVSATPWYLYTDLIKSVAIDEGVTSIGASAFRNCSKLVSVSIPSTVSKVGYAAFAECLRLTHVTCEGGLRAASECMFFNDDQLLFIEFSDDIATIPNYAFYGCCNLGDIRIPASVKTIGEGAFACCVSIETVIFGGEVTEIGTGAFFNCAGLSKIYLNSNEPKKVNDYAFYGCSNQLSVVGSTNDQWLVVEDATVVSAESSDTLSGEAGSLTWVFDPGEASLTISGNGDLPDYGQGEAPWLLYSALISAINVEEGVTRLGEMCFSEMSCVRTIQLPDTLRIIGPYAFAGCTSLTDCKLPAGVTSIGEGAFCCCAFLTTIHLPEAITSIPDYLCSECYSLKTVSFSGKINSVGYGAFNSCVSLESTGFLGSVQTIGGWAFAFCKSLTDHVKVFGSIGEYAFFCCSNLKEVDFSETTSMEQFAFSQSGITEAKLNVAEVPVSAFELCEELTDVVCLSNVRTIETDAFYGCKSLVNLNLGEVASLGDYALMATGMTHVSIPDSVSSLGIGVFADCVRLEAIEAGDAYDSIDGVLYQAGKLLQYPAGKRISTFTIPEFVDTIGDYAFYGCRNLTNLYMGDDVKDLGKASFAYCENLAEIVLSSGIRYLPDAVFGGDKNLSSIVFSGTAPARIGDDALYRTSEELIFKYLPGKSGWTDQQWVGPDGQAYSTQCITDNYLVSLEKIDGMTLRVELTCRIPVNRPLAIVVSALENGKTVATKTSIVKSESACYHVSLNGDSVEVFLLDAQTAAPLAAKTSLFGLSASANQDCEIHIQKVETNLKSRGVLALYSDTEHEVCSTETQSVTVTQLKARALDVDKPAVISTLRVNKDVLWDWTHPFQNGGVISLTLSTKNVRFRLDASRALAGDYRQANALAYFDAKFNESITFRDANGNFQRPRFQYDDHFKVGVLSIGLESHELLRETIKVKYNHNVEIISAQYDGTLDTDGALNVSVQGDFVNYGYDLNVVGAQRGETLLNISGNTGLGPGWSSPSIPLGKYGGLTGFTPDRISVGFGTPTNKHGWNQYGMNLNTNIDFNPGEFVKFIKAEYSDDFIDWASAVYAFVVETVDEANQKVDEQAFIRYTLDAENKVEDAWMMPSFTAKYLQGDALFNQALPKSQGGTVMPADSAKQTGGGKVNTSGKNNQLSQAEQEAIKQATTAAELAGKMPNISYIDQTFPQNIQTQISTSTGSGITGVGLPQDQIQSIIKDLGHGVYQIPFSIW